MEEAKQHMKRNARNTFPTRNNSRNDSNLTSLKNPNQIGSINRNIGDNRRRANSYVGGRMDALNDLLPEQEANCSPVSAYYVQIIGEKKELVVDNDTNYGAATLKRSLSPTPGYFLPNDVEGDLPSDFPDFSPLPYEYTIDSNTDGWTLPSQHHCAAGSDDSSTKKRQKTLESAWAKRCQQNSGITTLCLPNVPRPLNHVTCRRESYRTHDELPVHHDEQSTIPHLKEEHKQQHEYLSATLNFPYKDFIANHNKNDSHLQLWCDEEEQSRLEKHFDTKWQVEFFSKFYSGESQSLETPVDDIFGPKPSSSSSEKEMEKDNFSARNARRSPLSASTTQSEEDDEIVFVSMTSNTFKNSSANRHFSKEGRRTDHSNMSHNEICTSRSGSSADSSNILLEEAAIKLSAAMDDTDKTRDLIASIEKEMQINRDEILKVRAAYVAHNRQDEEGR